MLFFCIYILYYIYAESKEIMTMKNKRTVFFSLTTVLLCLALAGSNLVWYKLYARESNKVKNAVIPTFSEDYFTSQLNAVKDIAELPDDYMPGENEYIPEANEYISEKYYDDKDIYLSADEYAAKALDDEYYKELIDAKQRGVPVILNIPFVSQNPDYPNGCEAASAVMLLNWAGINISLHDFITDFLPRSDVYDENGYRYGPDPSVYYAGDPADTSRGWGVFEPAVYTAMANITTKDYEENDNNVAYFISSSNTHGKISLAALSKRNEPAMIWVTQDYSKASDVYEWFSYDRKKTYTYPKNAHVVVLTGSDEENYHINDPLKGKDIKVNKQQLSDSFNSMGAQYISIMKYYY